MQSVFEGWPNDPPVKCVICARHWPASLVGMMSGVCEDCKEKEMLYGDDGEGNFDEDIVMYEDEFTEDCE